MSTTQEQWDKSFAILHQFERQLIDPSEFCWKYITDQVGVSKATLWRNTEFESEYQRVKTLIKAYVRGDKQFDQVASIKAAKERDKDQQIERLKAKVDELNHQLSRERERLVLIARRKNIDPAEFIENSPLNRKVGNKEKIISIDKNSLSVKNSKS
jgi:uncharacterized protein YqgV (UPF0045/DUF77 family)